MNRRYVACATALLAGGCLPFLGGQVKSNYRCILHYGCFEPYACTTESAACSTAADGKRGFAVDYGTCVTYQNYNCNVVVNQVCFEERFYDESDCTDQCETKTNTVDEGCWISPPI